MSTGFVIAVVVLVILAIAVGGVLIYKNNQKKADALAAKAKDIVTTVKSKL